jgi:hypothetical protein
MVVAMVATTAIELVVLMAVVKVCTKAAVMVE